MPTYPKALDAPAGQTTVIGTTIIEQVVQASKLSPRNRILLPLHKGPEAPLHRMLNAIQPQSYIRPHRHLHPPKPETIIVLQGAILCIVFTPSGEIQEVQTIAAGTDELGFDCEPWVYHTFLSLRTDTVIFEVKPGPYEVSTDKDFATWAPPEGSPEAGKYLAFLYSLQKVRQYSPPQDEQPGEMI